MKWKDYDVEQDVSHMEEYPLGFCPVIKQKCNAKCICYVPCRCQRLPNDKWRVYEPTCSHVLITGEIYVMQD